MKKYRDVMKLGMYSEITERIKIIVFISDEDTQKDIGMFENK